MSKFKVGDEVVMNSDYYETEDITGGSFKKGSIVQITYIKGDHSLGIKNLITGDSRQVYYDRVDFLEEKTPELKVNYILLPDSVTLSFDGKLLTIKSDDNRYSKIIEAIKDNKLELIPDLVDVSKAFNSIEGVELIDGRIKLQGKFIPEVLSNRVLAFKDQNLPFEPLIKFSEKLLNNTSFNSRKMLYEFLEHNGHPITKNGNFIAYKKVKSDFTDIHTGKMDNSLGKVVEMPREDVDDNPDNTCSSGLHVAAYNYAKNFSSGHLVEVEINPEDVVAVPNDYNGEKMRVCKYKVVNICESKLEDVELYEDYSDEDDISIDDEFDF